MEPEPDPAAELTLLGREVRGPVRALETFPAPKSVTWVTLESSELTSVCPVTGQPDLASVAIGYRPNGRRLESKSLKQAVRGCITITARAEVGSPERG